MSVTAATNVDDVSKAKTDWQSVSVYTSTFTTKDAVNDNDDVVPKTKAY